MLWAISWVIDAVLLGISLRAMRRLGRASGGPWRRMFRTSVALIALLIASAVLVVASEAFWARLTALLLTGCPAIALVGVLLYVMLAAMLARDWK